MSISLKVDVIGLRELEKALKDLGVAAGQKGGPVKTALMAAALPVLRSAQAKVPVSAKGTFVGEGEKRKHVKPGRLKRAIKRQRHPNPRYLNEIVGVGVDPGTTRDDERGAYYGYIVEFRQPFLRPAMESNREKSVQIFKRKLGASIEKIGKQVGNKNAQAVGAKARTGKPFVFRGALKS